MARGAGGGIPGNGLGQGSTSPSTFTHVLGVSGATIGAVGGAADGRRNMGKTSFGSRERVPHARFCANRTQWTCLAHHPHMHRKHEGGPNTQDLITLWVNSEYRYKPDQR